MQFFARMLQNFVFAEWTDNFIHLLRIITIKLLHLYLRVVQMKHVIWAQSGQSFKSVHKKDEYNIQLYYRIIHIQIKTENKLL